MAANELRQFVLVKFHRQHSFTERVVELTLIDIEQPPDQAVSARFTAQWFGNLAILFRFDRHTGGYQRSEVL
jgi:hypothetical protein